MSGVIDERGQQWEHCNACAIFVRIQDLRYEPPADRSPRRDGEPELEYIRRSIGRDLCASCAAGNPPKSICQVCRVKYVDRATRPKCITRVIGDMYDPADYEFGEENVSADGVRSFSAKVKPGAKPGYSVDYHVWVPSGLRSEFFQRK